MWPGRTCCTSTEADAAGAEDESSTDRHGGRLRWTLRLSRILSARRGRETATDDDEYHSVTVYVHRRRHQSHRYRTAVSAGDTHWFWGPVTCKVRGKVSK